MEWLLIIGPALLYLMWVLRDENRAEHYRQLERREIDWRAYEETER